MCDPTDNTNVSESPSKLEEIRARHHKLRENNQAKLEASKISTAFAKSLITSPALAFALIFGYFVLRIAFVLLYSVIHLIVPVLGVSACYLLYVAYVFKAWLNEFSGKRVARGEKNSASNKLLPDMKQ